MIIALHGADHKVGVTMITEVLAELLHEHAPARKILTLHLDGKCGAEYAGHYREAGPLDNLKVQLRSNLLTQEEIVSNCYNRGAYYAMRGAEAYADGSYTPEMAESLIAQIAPWMDLIIIDAGNGLRSGLSAGALLASDVNIFVTTQQRTPLCALERRKGLYEALDINFQGIVINKFCFGSGLCTEQDLADRYEIGPVLGALPLVNPGYAWQAEAEKLTLLELDRAYRKAAAALHANICERIGWRKAEEKRKRKRMGGLLK